MIDTSLSMKPIFPQVRESLLNFLHSLGQQDRLTLFTFDSKVQKIYIGRAKEPGLKQFLPLQPNPQGQHTDIGLAFNQAVADLKRAPEDLNIFIFMTDGLDDPPPGSAFKQPQSWQKLQTKAKELSFKRVLVFGLGLNQQTDVAQLKKVFKNPRIMTANSKELNRYFTTLKEQIKQEKLRTKIAQELKVSKIKFKVSRVRLVKNNQAELTLTAASTYQKLPVYLSFKNLQVAVKKLKVAKVTLLSTKITLKPGQRKNLVMKINFTLTKQPLAPAKEKIYEGVLKFKVNKRFAYQNLITKLHLGNPQVNQTNLKFQLSRQVGYSYLTIALALSFLLLAGLASWRLIFKPFGLGLYRQITPPLLPGRLVFYASPEKQRLPPPVLLKQYGSKVILGSKGDIKLSGPDIKEMHAELVAVWEGKKSAVYLQALEGEIKVAAKRGEVPLPTKKVRLQKGAQISLGGYKIQWL